MKRSDALPSASGSLQAEVGGDGIFGGSGLQPRYAGMPAVRGTDGATSRPARQECGPSVLGLFAVSGLLGHPVNLNWSSPLKSLT